MQMNAYFTRREIALWYSGERKTDHIVLFAVSCIYCRIIHTNRYKVINPVEILRLVAVNRHYKPIWKLFRKVFAFFLQNFDLF